MQTKDIHGVRKVRSLGRGICFFTFRMDFELRGWPPQPPTFKSTFYLILALKKKVPGEW